MQSRPLGATGFTRALSDDSQSINRKTPSETHIALEEAVNQNSFLSTPKKDQAADSDSERATNMFSCLAV